MPLYSLIFKDLRKSTFLRMDFINEDRNRHFSKYIEAMVDADMLIEKQEVDYSFDVKIYEKMGWVEDPALYDRLLMEYSAKTGKFLKGWVI